MPTGEIDEAAIRRPRGIVVVLAGLVDQDLVWVPAITIRREKGVAWVDCVIDDAGPVRGPRGLDGAGEERPRRPPDGRDKQHIEGLSRATGKRERDVGAIGGEDGLLNRGSGRPQPLQSSLRQ